MNKILYYLWKDGERIGYDKGYYTIEEAIEEAIENNVDEVEETTWNNEEDYQNYEPADILGLFGKDK